eukprot:scaffold34597_cov177-Amphora_coffeaeformis.AAC.23
MGGEREDHNPSTLFFERKLRKLTNVTDLLNNNGGTTPGPAKCAAATHEDRKMNHHRILSRFRCQQRKTNHLRQKDTASGISVYFNEGYPQGNLRFPRTEKT